VKADFKHGRVSDPRKPLSHDREKAVKKHCKEFFEKAWAKYKERQKKKAEKDAKEGRKPEPRHPKKEEDEEDVKLEDVVSEDEGDDGAAEPSPAASNDQTPDLKRKRDTWTPEGSPGRDDKKVKSEDNPPPPPPPPPPPVEDMDVDDSGITKDEDAEDSFHNEAVQAVNGHPSKPQHYPHEPSPELANGEDHVEHLKRGTSGHPSPMQLATPSTNGSYEIDKDHKSKGMGFGDVDVERRRQVET